MYIYTYQLSDKTTVLVVAEDISMAKHLLENRLNNDGVIEPILQNSKFKLQDSSTRRDEVL